MCALGWLSGEVPWSRRAVTKPPVARHRLACTCGHVRAAARFIHYDERVGAGVLPDERIPLAQRLCGLTAALGRVE